MLQLVFNTVGWGLVSTVWSSIRGGDNVSWDPDFRDAVTSGLLNTDFAVTNLFVSAGAVSRYIIFIVYLTHIVCNFSWAPRLSSGVTFCFWETTSTTRGERNEMLMMTVGRRSFQIQTLNILVKLHLPINFFFILYFAKRVPSCKLRRLY